MAGMLSGERFTLPYGEEWYVRNVWRGMLVSLRAKSQPQTIERNGSSV
jgi:hypothetical protein